jgi:hypothetical protein
MEYPSPGKALLSNRRVGTECSRGFHKRQGSFRMECVTVESFLSHSSITDGSTSLVIEIYHRHPCPPQL